MILEAFPRFTFVNNENFGETNTSKSLLRALRNTDDGGVLWLNGDVVFDESLPPLLRAALERDSSFVSVNTSSVGDEEVKYDLSADGSINSAVQAGLPWARRGRRRQLCQRRRQAVLIRRQSHLFN